MTSAEIKTPAYVFDAESFLRRVQTVQEALPGIPLCYAMKANAFLLHCLPEEIKRVEVCSPGELKTCKRLGILGEKIIYSGVVKGAEDAAEAIRYGAGLITAESPSQFELVKNEAAKARAEGKIETPVRVLLRLTSGNQFGMNAEDIEKIISENAGTDTASEENAPDFITITINIVGIHFYSGTQKKKAKQIEKDLKQLEGLLTTLQSQYGYVPEIVEYGPGLSTAYFGGTKEELETADLELLQETAPILNDFAKKYPLSLEFGRFFAAPTGDFYTKVVDIKTNEGVTYALTDGGIHHLKYYGQTMSMQIPPIELHEAEEIATNVKESKPKDCETTSAASQTYCLCGSLCTVADVLVREVELPMLSIGDTLTFGRCGAYSITEASALFLSRPLPRVYLKKKDGEFILLRENARTEIINA